MASLFLARPQSSQVRVISHGGLGGLVCPASGDNERLGAVVAEGLIQTEGKVWADGKGGRGRRRRPPPIQVQTTTPLTRISASQLSVSSDMDYIGPWTPITPKDRIRSQSLVENDTNEPSSSTTTTTTCSLISRYNSATPSTACFSPPQTPINARAALNHSLPVELPGSLLLASQGFPQNDPISPPPSLHRRDTEGSSVSSLPALSVSSTVYEGEMDAIRHLTYPLRKNDRSGDIGEMPTYVITGQPAQEQVHAHAQITKPLTAMTLEELMDCLSHLDSSTVSELWLPAMRAQLQQVTSLLQDACELKLDAILEETASNNVSIPPATLSPVFLSA